MKKTNEKLAGAESSDSNTESALHTLVNQHQTPNAIDNYATRASKEETKYP